MPIYEYRCRSCGDEFESLVPISMRDSIEHSCPNCGSSDIERKLSCVCSPVIKGSCSGCSGGSCSMCG